MHVSSVVVFIEWKCNKIIYIVLKDVKYLVIVLWMLKIPFSGSSWGQKNVEDVAHLTARILFQITDDPTLNQVFDKIMVAVYKNGIRTTEFFRDHDPLRSGIITENQFVCGLALAVGKEAQLSRAEIQKVVEFYRQPDGRVAYKDFCDIMENGKNNYFTFKSMEMECGWPKQVSIIPISQQSVISAELCPLMHSVLDSQLLK